MHPGACTRMCSRGRSRPVGGLPQVALASPGQQQRPWGSLLKHGPPLGVSAGSPRGPVCLRSWQRFRAGVHPVPGFSAVVVVHGYKPVKEVLLDYKSEFSGRGENPGFQVHKNNGVSCSGVGVLGRC